MQAAPDMAEPTPSAGPSTASAGTSNTANRRCALPVPADKMEALACPVLTLHNRSYEEMHCKEVPDIRAYKLGKKRWSYNQFDLRVHNEGSESFLEVKEALQSTTPANLQGIKDSTATYKVRLTNNFYVVVHAFMVYETALEVELPDEAGNMRRFYQWVCVDRCACKKRCEGPVLRPIQRFGRVGKRSGPEAPKNQAGQLKNYKYMYLSLDEAGTHVGGSRFRLLFAVYDTTGTTLLGTTVSTPIRVLANNDVPTGAAHVGINVALRSDWVGWYNVCPLTLKPLPAPDGHQNMERRLHRLMSRGQELIRQHSQAQQQFLMTGAGAQGPQLQLQHQPSMPKVLAPGQQAQQAQQHMFSLDHCGSMPTQHDDGSLAHARSLSRHSASPELLSADLAGGGGGNRGAGPAGAACISPGDSTYSTVTNNTAYGAGASPCLQGVPGPLPQHLSLSGHKRAAGQQGGQGGGQGDAEMELQELLRSLNGGGQGGDASDLLNNHAGMLSHHHLQQQQAQFGGGFVPHQLQHTGSGGDPHGDHAAKRLKFEFEQAQHAAQHAQQQHLQHQLSSGQQLQHVGSGYSPVDGASGAAAQQQHAGDASAFLVHSPSGGAPGDALDHLGDPFGSDWAHHGGGGGMYGGDLQGQMPMMQLGGPMDAMMMAKAMAHGGHAHGGHHHQGGHHHGGGGHHHHLDVDLGFLVDDDEDDVFPAATGAPGVMDGQQGGGGAPGGLLQHQGSQHVLSRQGTGVSAEVPVGGMWGGDAGQF